jgi:hypothetical protein
MMQIPRVTTPTYGAPTDTSDAADETNSAADDNAVEADASAVPGDRWTSFIGRGDLHPDVPRFTGEPRERQANAPVLRWGPDAEHKEVGKGQSNAPTGFDVDKTKPEQIEALKQTSITDKQLNDLKHKDVSAKELARLEKSSKPADHEKAQSIRTDRQQAHDIEASRRLANTIEHAKDSYRDLIKAGGRVVVTASAANGGQPVMVVMGPGFKGDKNAVIQTHYHGDNATVADPEGSKAGMNTRITDTVMKNPQTVFVVPEAANAPATLDSPTHYNEYHADWTEVKSQVQTTADALAAAGVKKPTEQIVSFHSGAGKVMQVLMNLDPSGSLIKANRLELFDCLYGTPKYDFKKPDPAGWERSFESWAGTANGKAVERVIYYHGTNDGPRSNVIRDAFKSEKVGGRFSRYEMNDKALNDPKINPKVLDANGKDQIRVHEWDDKDGHHVSRSVVHRFERDNHYQTVGQYLGTDPMPREEAPTRARKR